MSEVKPRETNMQPDHKSIFAIWRLCEAVRDERITASDALRAIAADERVQRYAKDEEGVG